jgi:hypothetical protein
MGPIGKAMKFAAAQMPTAFGRSSSLNSTVSAESAMTMMPAPAIPSTTRAAMKSTTVLESAHNAEPTPKSTSDPSIHLLPAVAVAEKPERQHRRGERSGTANTHLSRHSLGLMPLTRLCQQVRNRRT